jgi:hypothetical protein
VVSGEMTAKMALEELTDLNHRNLPTRLALMAEAQMTMAVLQLEMEAVEIMGQGPRVLSREM